MSDSDSRKCFYSKDGVTTEGPLTFSEVKRLHSAGNLHPGVLCSMEDQYANTYDFWRPVGRYNLKRLDFDSRSRPGPLLADILKIYLGWFVGVNIGGSKEFSVVRLMRVEHEFFSVSPRQSEDAFHYSYRQVLSVVESIANIESQIQKPVDKTIKQGALSKFFIGTTENAPIDWSKVKIEVPLLVEVNHLIVYTGSTGVGVSVPIG